MSIYHRVFFVALPLALTMTAAPATAQWRYPPPGYPPYPAYAYAGADSSLRINVTPRDASVYVDGYFAGKVDEFDGRFQRLRVLPGEHEIVVFLDGYRSLTQHLYLGPNASRTIEGALEKLAPGEAPDPQPRPAPRAFAEPPDAGYPPPDGGRPDQPLPPRRMPPPDRAPEQPRTRQAPMPEPGPPSRFAALSLRVDPGGATVIIDGQRWDGPSGNERLIVQVAEGHHTVEVERKGYERFATELDVTAGETVPVTISLKRQ